MVVLSLALMAVISLRAALGEAQAMVSGMVWEDINGNASFDPGERLVVGQELLLEGPHGGSSHIRTDGNGSFQFNEAGGVPITPGSYRLLLGGGVNEWVATSPRRILGGPIVFDLTVGSTPVEVKIGLVSQASLAQFRGTAVVNGQAVERLVVEALVNGRLCSFPSGFIYPHDGSDDPSSRYWVAVASDALMPGCGRPGDQVSFRVNGLLAHQTAAWQPGTTILDLNVGAAVPATPTGPNPSPPTKPQASAIRPPDTGDAGLR